jgi:hypothetical protein
MSKFPGRQRNTTATVIILLWVIVMLSGKFNARFLQAAIGSVGLYLILNIIFLARESLTNVEQGGGLSITLFALMFLTLALSIVLAVTHRET